MQAIEYRVNPARPGAHIFEVTCTVPEPDPQGQRFTLPAWIPGSYLIRDFAGNILTLQAFDSDGQPLSATKQNKQTWLCEPTDGALTLQYEVYAWDASVRTAYLDTTRGFFNGTSLFLCPVGLEDSDALVSLEAPNDPACIGWQAATAMSPVSQDAVGFGTYRASNYEELIDHPVEMGPFTRISFSAGDTRHHLILAGVHNANRDRLASDLARLCNTHVALFGDPTPPMGSYHFLTRVTGNGFGGLEHRASSSLVCSRKSLPTASQGEPDDDYRTFLGLCSHEYFHVWNVKRIRPAAFHHADLSREAYTEDLWAYEGITAYYDELMLVRSGLVNPRQYMNHLSKSATRLWQTPARHKQSLAQSSYDAWIKFYKQGDDAPNTVVSYYNKGSLVALCLDLKLRLETDGKVSLDHVMRAMWNEFGREEKPVPDRQIEQVAERVSGLKLGAFFDSMIRGVEDPPLADLLSQFGVACSLQSARDTDATKPGLYLGIMLRPGQRSPVITHVLDGGPAQKAGLAAGDEVLAVNGLRVEGDNMDTHLRGAPTGKVMDIHVFRRDELMQFKLVPGPAPRDTWAMSLIEDAPEASRKRRAAWLGQPDK